MCRDEIVEGKAKLKLELKLIKDKKKRLAGLKLKIELPLNAPAEQHEGNPRKCHSAHKRFS